MSLFNNILFPTDFSAHARAALKYASAFACDGGGRVIVFSAVGSKVPGDLLQLHESVFEQPEYRWLAEVRSELIDLLGDPLLKGIEVEHSITEGEPVAEISRAVVDH